MAEKIKQDKTIKLRVVESLQDDAYKGIARIDPSLMKKLELERGDIILVRGERDTYSVVDHAYPADRGEEIIRIDGITRKNSKTGIGEQVEIKKAKIREAKKITIAPAQQGIVVRGDPDNFKRGLLGKPVTKGDIVVMGGTQRRRDLMSEDMGDMFGDFGEIFNQMGFGGGMPGGLTQIRFAIVSTNPNQPVIITENTQITLSPKAVDISEEAIPQITYEDIGGLKEEVKKVREMVELPLKRPEIFARLGIEPPKGVLLYGPPGTGKTLLAKAVANESEAHFILLNGPEIMSKFYGESEKKIREIFDEAEKNAPSIIFIDEIDAIAPKREEVGGEVERRVVSQLLTMMDGLQSRGKVVVIGATNRPNALDPALRRPGRFDREVEISVPDKEGRLQVLKIHTRGMPLTKNVDLTKIASKTHGFVGADLQSLAKEAAMAVLRKHIHKFNLEEDEEIPKEVLDVLKISMKDFDEALKVVRPSAMREVLVETPDISWEDIGGVETVKQDLKEAVEWPMKFPESFTRMGIRPPRGILLYGPPGTGKTLLAKAVANESEANFILVKGPELLSMWVGKSEEGVRKIFERARQVSPCIVFFDEIDSLAGKRGQGFGGGAKVTENVLNQLLSEMDGIEDLSNVIVIGATNRPDMLDSALMRPGRFDRIVYVGVPGKEGREMILKIHTKNMPIDKSVNLKKLAEETEGYTGADLESLTREAAMLALREDLNTKNVTKKDFDKAMEKVVASVSKADVERYKQVEQQYLRSAKAALAEKATYAG
ncbi:CDC48 family AAA ATPase [archaeon]|jgi:transitional endoplasmic reticulum ATPase|nr:CDC48 family AAA ATPase [archaeon]MBT3577415.1 CDC48 family AAA ATPase [archaeon]MBT6820342.1 CDC48 family AAA ATPase [archaeon]MBT6956107.1 CDC48 family AAA ATPase [archaeon]MBT7025156.1 CDC48 family AAA ATPase [archaeon]